MQPTYERAETTLVTATQARDLYGVLIRSLPRKYFDAALRRGGDPFESGHEAERMRRVLAYLVGQPPGKGSGPDFAIPFRKAFGEAFLVENRRLESLVTSANPGGARVPTR